MSAPLIQFPLGGSGMVDSVDPKHLQPGQLSSIINAVFMRDGTLDKRFGYANVQAASVNIKRVAAFKDSTIAVDSLGQLNTVVPTMSSPINARGRLPNVLVTRDSLASVAAGIVKWDWCYSNGVYCVVYLQGNGNGVAVFIDSATGAIIRSDAANIGGDFRVLLVGSTVLLYTPFSTSIVSYSNSITAPTAWSGPVTVQTGVGAKWDACAMSALAVLSWVTGSGPYTLHVATYNTGGAMQSTGGQTINNPDRIALRGTTGETLWSVWSEGGTPGVWAWPLDPSTLAQQHAAVNVITPSSTLVLSVERVDATHAVVVADNKWCVVSNAGAITVSSTTLSSSPISKPFMFGGNCYILLTSGNVGTPNGTNFLVSLPISGGTTLPSLYQATLFPRIANLDWTSISSGGGITTNYLPTGGVAVSSTAFEFIAPACVDYLAGVSLNKVHCDTDPSKQYLTSQSGDLTYIGPCAYDGFEPFEIGFSQLPQVTLSTTGAGNMAAGTYDYVACYEWQDAQGNWHRGGPSNPLSVTVGASASATLSVSAVQQSMRLEASTIAGANVYIYVSVFRTKVGGTTYFRITPEPFQNYLTRGSSTLSYTDGLADSTITGDPHTYPVAWFEGGVLGGECPESPVFSATYKSRPILLGADERTMWLGQVPEPGTASTFNDALTIRLDSTTQKIVGMCQCFDYLAIFTKTQVWQIAGDGPSPSGLNSDLTAPRMLNGSIGCIERRSIVSTPLGVMFQSSRGIELLDGAGNVSFIGSDVSLTLATRPVITSATVVPSQSHVRFTCKDADNASGVGFILVYDYRRGRWAEHNLIFGGSFGSVPGLGITSAALTTSGYFIAGELSSSEGYLRKEDLTTHLDIGAFNQMVVETGWIGSGGEQGWQRVRSLRLLGDWYSYNGINIQMAADYGSYTDTRTWSDADIESTRLGSPAEWITAIPVPQKCSSFRVKVNDVAPSTNGLGTGQGMSFASLALEIAPSQGGNRQLPPAGRK